MNTLNLRKWDSAEHLKTEEDMAQYLLLRPDEVSSGIADSMVLEVGDDSLRRAVEHRHVFVGGLA